MTDENLNTVPPVDTGGLPQDAYDFIRLRHGTIIVPPTAKIICSGMETYCQRMSASSPITPKDGAEQQRKLYYIFLTACSAVNGEYIVAMSLMLYYMDKYADTVFTDRLAFRFLTDQRLTTIVTKFQMLMTLFRTTANPGGRRLALQRIDLARMVAHLPSEQAREHVLSFYLTIQ